MVWPDREADRLSLKLAVDLCAQFVTQMELHAALVREARERGELSPFQPTRAGWLTLSGVYGCGKTRLADAVTCHLMGVNPFAGGVWLAGTNEYSDANRRPGVVWHHANAFLERTLGGDYGYPEFLGREWVVVIDDLGATRQGSDNSREAANDAISRLCAARAGKMTLFTTNWTVGEIAQRIDGRIASRLIRDGDGNQFHRITAGDYALRGKGAK